MTNYRVQHCPKIGASIKELGGISASEQRIWQNNTLYGQVAREQSELDALEGTCRGEDRKHCPEIGQHFRDLKPISVSEQRRFFHAYLQNSVIDEEITMQNKATGRFSSWRVPVKPCPKIGASWEEMGGRSASETRRYWDNYLEDKLAGEEEAVRNRPHAFAFVREQYTETPIKHNPLLDIIDKANKSIVEETKEREGLN